MTVDAGDIVRVVARFVSEGEAAQNTFYVRHDSTSSQVDGAFDLAVAVWLGGAWNGIAGLLSDEHAAVDIVIQNLTEGTPARFSEWETFSEGTNATELLPLQCCGLVNFPTNVAKRQGRKFLAGLTLAATETAGTLSTSVASGLASWAADILTGGTIGDGEIKAGIYNVLSEVFAELQSAVVNGVLKTQRRRVKGVGI